MASARTRRIGSPARARRSLLVGASALALTLGVFSLVQAQGQGSALERQPFAGANQGLFNGQDGPVVAGDPQLVRVFQNLRLDNPTDLGPVPGTNRLYVVEQDGRIITFENDPGVRDFDVLVDISRLVGQGGANERGALQLEFDPEFEQNGFFYVYYTGGNGQFSNFDAFLDRFQVTGGGLSSNVNSRCNVLTVRQPQSNHNGVGMFFDNDGFLFVSFGDGGAANDDGPGHAPEGNGQATNTLLGKVVRLRVETDNPRTCDYNTAGNAFSNAAGTASNGQGMREIFALGVRHPYRMTMDRLTGDLFFGDVGQNAKEEISFLSSEDIDAAIRTGTAPNFGWPCREGSIAGPNRMGICRNGSIDPIFDYDSRVGASVIGGFVYRGSSFPQLQGQYIYGRFGEQALHALAPNAQGTSGQDRRLFSTATLGGRPWSIGEDAQGEIYVIFGQSSQIRKLTTEDALASAPTGGQIPQMLSQTGLFANTAGLVFASGVVPYAVNSRLFSDNLVKSRAFAIPDGTTIEFDPMGRFIFPLGSVVLKHFEDENGARIETRILARTQDVWRGFTYQWLDDQSDATLVGTDLQTVTLQNGELYDLPSRADCQRCHNTGDSAEPQQIIGLQARQINFDRFFERDANTGGQGMMANQLQALSQAGFFSQRVPMAQLNRVSLFPKNPPENLDGLTNAEINLAARSFLESNCAICHRPGGGTPTAIDLQFDTANEDTLIFNEFAGEGPVEDAERVILAGDPAGSVLLVRMMRLVGQAEQGMPPVSHRQLDQEGIALITRWIQSIDENGNPLPDS